MYHCKDCGRTIKAKAGDAVHMLQRGPVCAECLLQKPAALVEIQQPNNASKMSRSDRMKARWAQKTPEERRERAAKMRAGRGKEP